MKLIGSYSSPYVRKISVILLEKGIIFEFINRTNSDGEDIVARYNPLNKVPVLVADDNSLWFDSPVIAGYLEECYPVPPLRATDVGQTRYLLQVEALADGLLEAATLLSHELKKKPAQQNEQDIVALRAKITQALDWLEQQLVAGALTPDAFNIGTIAIGCAIGFINRRRIAQGWCVDHPQLIRLVENVFRRESFVRTEPDAS
ncbi:glutathione S-transferase [Shimwellia pseudoproteus]|uniref:glutathione S-transferase n=1 Tax=Shimwellia pseudoproteus TaxID=570012 RepID=UPI0018EA6D8C|nr:glutathione S-transferase [Shimwellia pseudoproteus]MBJ3814331.1 glutathione S-transferase [Shimwellia pseudoproteus]